jgi:DNA-binding transcriptional LysR family regulator
MLRVGDKRLSLRALQTFEAAGEHLSMSRAAEALAVTQSAVSHQVRNLERELGTALFTR